MSDDYEVPKGRAAESLIHELGATALEDEVREINLTEYAQDLLRTTSIGSAEAAIAALFDALGLTTEQLNSFDLRGLVQGIPGVGDLIDNVLAAPLHLTDLRYEPEKVMEIGILINFDLNVGPVKVSKVGLKVTHYLSEAA